MTRRGFSIEHIPADTLDQFTTIILLITLAIAACELIYCLIKARRGTLE